MDHLESLTDIVLHPEVLGAARRAGEEYSLIAWAVYWAWLTVTGHHERHNVIDRRDATAILLAVRDVDLRRVQQILQVGEGSYWHSDTPERLRLVGLSRIAERLGVPLRYQPHKVPISEIRTRAGITATAANLALPIDQDRARPMTRARKRAVSGVSERQQRRIDASPLGSELVESVYAQYEGQWPDGHGNFITDSGSHVRRIADIRVPTQHSPASLSRVTNARRRSRRQDRPLTSKAVAATGGASPEDATRSRLPVFQHRRRRDAMRAWERAGSPRGMLVYWESGRWTRKLVGGT